MGSRTCPSKRMNTHLILGMLLLLASSAFANPVSNNPTRAQPHVLQKFIAALCIVLAALFQAAIDGVENSLAATPMQRKALEVERVGSHIISKTADVVTGMLHTSHNAVNLRLRQSTTPVLPM
eukprot:c2506_g1_i1.p1 GENE.c2506_g1_i1~~c2506_g1_i1.p1  ORF type:complete len:123 (+),score=22.73 c2506_g1_i1:1-369(+)